MKILRIKHCQHKSSLLRCRETLLARAERLRLDGKSLNQIAVLTGLHRNTVSRYARRKGQVFPVPLRLTVPFDPLDENQVEQFLTHVCSSARDRWRKVIRLYFGYRYSQAAIAKSAANLGNKGQLHSVIRQIHRKARKLYGGAA